MPAEQFAISFNVYSYTKIQRHNSIQSWIITDLILGITLGKSKCTWKTHMNGLNHIDVFMYAYLIYMHKIKFIPKFIFEI